MENWLDYHFSLQNDTLCGNYGNLLSHFFDKNLVKATVFPKKLCTKELFSRIIYQQDVRVNFSILNTVCFFSFTWGRNLNPKSGAIRVLNADKTMTFLIYLWDIPFCQSCLKVLSNLEILYIVRRRKGWHFFPKLWEFLPWQIFL